MKRRESHITDWMGMTVGGLSVDQVTYFDTDLRHRCLWWWLQSDVQGLLEQVQRLQIRRIQCELWETDHLVKRGLAILGNMSGEDPFHDCGESIHPSGGGGGGRFGRRRSHKGIRSKISVNGGMSHRSRNASRAGVREVYEKEIRRVRRRSRSASNSSSSRSRRSVSVSRSGVVERDPETHTRTTLHEDSRPPRVVEYEIVNPGRVWVDVEQPRENGFRSFSSSVKRPNPTHYKSYVRE